MKAFVVSDNEAISDKVRRVLIQRGHDCPESHVVSLADGPRIVNAAELTILVLSPDFELALLALKGMSAALGGIGLRASGKRILAVGPADARLILRTVREGADEYLDENEAEPELDALLVQIESEGAAGASRPLLVSVLAPTGSGLIELVSKLAEILADTAVVPIPIKPGDGGLDLPPEQVETLLKSDIVFLVLRLDFTSLRNARQTLDHLERMGVNRNRVRLLANRQGQPKEINMFQVEESLGMKIFDDIPGRNRRFWFGRGRFLFGEN